MPLKKSLLRGNASPPDAVVIMGFVKYIKFFLSRNDEFKKYAYAYFLIEKIHFQE
jgi:hypothetical protein